MCRCIYKLYLISTEGYINAGLHLLRVRKTDEIWVSMKNVHGSLGIKNMSNLVLKEIYTGMEQKTLQISKLEDTKWQKDKCLKLMII